MQLEQGDLKAYARILEGRWTLELYAKSYIHENMTIFPAVILKVSSAYQNKFKTTDLKVVKCSVKRTKAVFGV